MWNVSEDGRRRRRWNEKRARRLAQLLQRDPHVCHYCGVPLAVDGAGLVYHARSDSWLLAKGYSAHHIDHVIPMALGGSDDLENLVLSCSRCNEAKGARSDWQAT
jgi:5-methylcytosine-specific restriction endonuclease McrA